MPKDLVERELKVRKQAILEKIPAVPIWPLLNFLDVLDGVGEDRQTYLTKN